MGPKGRKTKTDPGGPCPQCGASPIAPTSVPWAFYPPLTAFLAHLLQRDHPTAFARVTRIVERHARVARMLSRWPPGLPMPVTLDELRISLATALRALRVGRGRIKPDLLIPRDDLGGAHRLLTAGLKQLRANLRAKDPELALEGAVALYTAPMVVWHR